MVIKEIVEKQDAYFHTNVTKSIGFRTKALDRLRAAILRNEQAINDALEKDLNKPKMEAYMTEIGMTLSELSYIRKHFTGWAKDKHLATALINFHSSSYIKAEPYGVVLIMSPWNYPFVLCMEPLIGAIAAGNCCVLKPSAYSPNTSAVIKKIIEECFIPEYITVVEGGRAENTTLLDQKFGYIFFTGSVSIGKQVMEKAAAHLTPVTLELGGKSPCIIDRSANIRLAAKRIVFGKFLNCGQTCVAPDYVLIQKEMKDTFLEYVRLHVRQMYGENAFAKQDYPRMINRKHYDRIMDMIDPDKVVCGGKGNPDTLQIAPTVLDNISGFDKVMQEEIFGPLLPVITFTTLDEAEQFVLKRPEPLACYIFTGSRAVETRLLQNLPFGGGCVNDTIMHFTSSRMGFGGVGYSGMGSYHGKCSFDTFTHKKSIMRKYNWIDLPMRYRPYTKFNERVSRIFFK